jgi:hypothetical protein
VDKLTPLGLSSGKKLAWLQGSDGPMLTYISGTEDSHYNLISSVVLVNVATGHHRTLVSVTYGAFDTLSATADGRYLVFAYGYHPLCADCLVDHPPSQLYVYDATAPSASPPSPSPVP